MEDTQRPDNLSSKSEDNESKKSDLLDLEDIETLKMRIINSEDSERGCELSDEEMVEQEMIPIQSLFTQCFESIISEIFKSNRL